MRPAADRAFAWACIAVNCALHTVRRRLFSLKNDLNLCLLNFCLDKGELSFDADLSDGCGKEYAVAGFKLRCLAAAFKRAFSIGYKKSREGLSVDLDVGRTFVKLCFEIFAVGKHAVAAEISRLRRLGLCYVESLFDVQLPRLSVGAQSARSRIRGRCSWNFAESRR